jgi:electron transfer flavoprotein alpha subunit
LEHFNSLLYQNVLSSLISKYQPLLTLIGHTAFGMDLAPSLSVEKGLPLATDCIGLSFEGDRLRSTRSIYGGKVNASVSLRESPGYIATIRPGTFSPAKPAEKKGALSVDPSPLQGTLDAKRFIEYMEAAAGEVDITQADILVSVGRGIKEAENIPIVKEFAHPLFRAPLL